MISKIFETLHVWKCPTFTLFVFSLFILGGCINGCSKVNNPNAITTSDEESATQYSLTETYDETRNGARLILSYDASTNSFKGEVENTTTDTLKQVRVEVHLSNGVELGPTTPKDLAPGEKMPVELIATEASFETWSAHPEVGSGGSGEGGEGSHANEADNEHQGGEE